MLCQMGHHELVRMYSGGVRGMVVSWVDRQGHVKVINGHMGDTLKAQN